jgi:PAS domain S-box-containing protein
MTDATDEITGAPALDRWIQQNLFDAAPIHIAVIDRDYNVVRANQSFEKTFGRWQHRKCYEVYKDRDTLCTTCKAAESFEDGRTRVNRELGYNEKGYVTRYIKHTVPIVEQGEVRYLVEMSVDVTDTELLREENELLFEQVPCNMFLLDQDLLIVRANRRTTESFGNVIGRYCYEVFKHADHMCRHCPVQHSLDDGMIHTGENEVIDAQGETRIFQLTTAPVGLTESDQQYVINMAVDITHLKQLEHEKLEAERLAAVGQTVAGLAHGVKNLLTGLEGAMYLIGTGLKKNNEKRISQGWEMLERNTERISRFVRGFLTFSKGRSVLAQPADPVAIAQEVVDLYSQQAQEAGVTLRCEAPATPIAEAPLDYEAMHECLTNLVGNAIDACQMSDAKNHDPVVELRVSEDDGTLVYEVEDTGVGMDYDVKQKVFTTFFTTKGLGGTGLGLLTTRRIVQEHGGTIDLTSEPGQGTTFRIELPRDHLPPVAEPESESESESESKPESDSSA